MYLAPNIGAAVYLRFLFDASQWHPKSEYCGLQVHIQADSKVHKRYQLVIMHNC